VSPLVFEARGTYLATPAITWNTDLLTAVPALKTPAYGTGQLHCMTLTNNRLAIVVDIWPGTLILDIDTGRVVTSAVGFVPTGTVGDFMVGSLDGQTNLEVRRADAISTPLWSTPGDTRKADAVGTHPLDNSDLIIADTWVRTREGYVPISGGLAMFGSDMSAKVFCTSSAGSVFRWHNVGGADCPDWSVTITTTGPSTRPPGESWRCRETSERTIQTH